MRSNRVMRSLVRDVFGDGAASSADAEFELFTRIRLPSGVHKTTELRRLDDVNERVLRFLPSDRPLELMDVAVSTAITTVEWSEQLTAAGIDHHLLAGDSHIDAAWLSLPFCDLLLDRDRNRLLLAVVLGRSIDVLGSSWRSALALPVLKTAVRVSKVMRVPMRHIELVSPRVRGCPAIDIVEDDIFVARPELRGRFHVVRAANILNRGYFDDARLRAAVAGLRERLRPGGLLIVCRTLEDGSNHGSFFKADGDGWTVIDRIGDGSEIERLIAMSS
jgi:hypothetical protein